VDGLRFLTAAGVLNDSDDSRNTPTSADVPNFLINQLPLLDKPHPTIKMVTWGIW
jgi:hypothetical protein